MSLPIDGPDFSLARDESEDVTGAYSWPAGVALAHELSTIISCHDKRVLDLGCGQGILGFTALQLGASIVHFSDGSPIVCDYVSRIIAHNQLTPVVKVFHHAWGTLVSDSEQHAYDIIVGGDLLYRANNIDILASTIQSHLAFDGICLLSDPRHTLELKLARHFASAGLQISVRRRKQYTLIRCTHMGQRG